MSSCGRRSLGSFISISSGVLVEKCEKMLEKIKKSREENNRQTIEKRRRKTHIFWGRMETDDEVKHRLSNEIFGPYPSTMWASSEFTARRLLRLCKHAKRVFLTSSDAFDVDL